ncbi:MAG: arylsulfatase [Gemmataceae bacterium]|nr:arylsulfatase [Gemmataceae bacterium]
MGFSDLGCYGSEIATPNIDRLAENGVRFTQFYNAARCCPTRASLLTGLYPHQAGVGHMVEDRGFPAYRGELNDRCVTIAEALRPAGYRTWMSGKWHVAPSTGKKDHWPVNRGFDQFFGLIGSVRSYYDPPTLTRDITPIQADKDFYLTDAITDNALTYLTDQGKKPEPFFLYVAYTAPHWPMHALPEDIQKYKGKYKQGWDELRKKRHQKMIELGLVDKRWPLTPRDAESPAWADARDKDWQDQRMAVYAAMIDRMDQGVGKIMGKLKELGKEKNTLVLFLSDNGGCAEAIPADWRGKMFPSKTRDGRDTKVGNDPAVLPGPADVFQSYGPAWANASNTPFRLYKHWVHEGGIATPLIASWPATIAKPAITHQPGHLIDIMATCLDVAGAEYPKKHKDQAIAPLEGKSLLPIFQGKTRQGHDALFWEHEGNRAVRQGKWKLVSRHPDAWELYDLEADRTELTNLSAKNPDLVKELAGKYARWAERCGVQPWEKVNAKKEK